MNKYLFIFVQLYGLIVSIYLIEAFLITGKVHVYRLHLTYYKLWYFISKYIFLIDISNQEISKQILFKYVIKKKKKEDIIKINNRFKIMNAVS